MTQDKKNKIDMGTPAQQDQAQRGLLPPEAAEEEVDQQHKAQGGAAGAGAGRKGSSSSPAVADKTSATTTEEEEEEEVEEVESAAQEDVSTLTAASILADASQCLDDIFRTAVLCFYEPETKPEEEEEEEEKKKKDRQGRGGGGGSDQDDEGPASTGPGYIVSLGKTILASSSSPSPAGANEEEGGGTKPMEGVGNDEGMGRGGGVAVEFGDVAVGKTARAVLRIHNRRHRFLDYAIRCSFANVGNCRLRVDGGQPFPGYAVQGSLRPGEKRDLVLEAEPSRTGPMDEGMVMVTVGGTTYEVVLRGTGVDGRTTST